MPRPISPETLKQMIEKKDDAAFLVVDVRPKDQYALNHIPGAVNLPVQEIGPGTRFPKDASEVIFYCQNGTRSKAAAVMAMDAGLGGDRILNLFGGMAAYTGEILLELPTLSVFRETADLQAAVTLALNLEKGAFQFYTCAAKLPLKVETVRFLDDMARFETDHARSLYHLLDSANVCFDDYFLNCAGDILEGGQSYDDVLAKLSSGHTGDETILDIALDIEVGAYDLYKRTAVKCESGSGRDLFLELAAAEKTHMIRVLDFLAICS